MNPLGRTRDTRDEARPLSPGRYLCDRVVPGNRVTIVGIYSIKRMAAAKGKERGVGVGIRASYLRVVGIQVDTEGAGTAGPVAGAATSSRVGR